MIHQTNSTADDSLMREWAEAYEKQYGRKPKARYMSRLNFTVSPGTMKREQIIATLAFAKETMIQMAIRTINGRVTYEVQDIIRQATRMATETRTSRLGSTLQRGIDLACA